MRERNWRILCASSAIAVLLPIGTPAAAAPTLAGQTTVTSWGPKALRVRLTRTVALDYRNPAGWITLQGSGSYAAVMIEQLRAVPPFTAGQHLLYGRVLPPAGCSAATVIAPSSCADPMYISWVVVYGPPSGPPKLMTLAPGDYLIYVLGDRGVTATLRIPGLSGRTSSSANIGVPAKSHLQLAHSVGGVGHIEGSWTERLAGTGILSGNGWSPTFETDYAWARTGASMTACWTRDATPDPTYSCNRHRYGVPDPAILVKEAASWRFDYNITDTSPPGGQFGAFALWLPFVYPALNRAFIGPDAECRQWAHDYVCFDDVTGLWAM